MRYLEPTRLKGRGTDALRTPVLAPRSLRSMHHQVLEAAARGDAVPDVMALLCRWMGRRAPWAVCTVIAVDEHDRLQPLAAPGLPPGASSGFQGIPIGPDVGSCGTAAYTRHPVETHDIDADPAWARWKAPILAEGLRACWSSPITGRHGRVIGTFAFYFRECRGPSTAERRLIASCVDVCRLVLDQASLLRRLQETNERFDVALSNMTQGVCFFDSDQRLIVANRRYCELYDLAPAGVQPGTTLEAIVALRVAAGSGPKMRADKYMGWRSTLHTDSTASETIVELENDRLIAIQHQPMPDGGWVATHEDITERRRVEAQIAHMARHDALTGLPNRLTFAERLDRALAYVGRGQACALLCLDLDRFKEVNDTLGHPAGDALLRGVAQRLLGCVREVDTVTRLGGDEFAILLVGMDGPDRAGEVAERIVRAFEDPFSIDGRAHIASTSIGVAVAVQDGTTAAQLLRSADTALYRAKADARGTYRFFEPEMDARRQVRIALERDLRAAVEAEAFDLAYQPLFDARSGEITGFEALLRWTHPDRGDVHPAEFIPCAEETGLILALGAWALRRACQEAATWPRPVKVSVNVAAAQFRNGALQRAVHEALHASTLPAARLELEVTEALLLKNGPPVIAALHELRAMGVSIALDNFGIGASSLSYLRSFPFSRIKIDRSFIHELASKPDALAIVRAIVGLGRSLAMTTTAGGVETEAQLAHLRDEGCREVQGFLFSRAVPAEQVRRMLS